tara:strand:- start:717 stop:845 length:129 start_codon:yes stop_codon:yes gene_type:complete
MGLEEMGSTASREKIMNKFFIITFVALGMMMVLSLYVLVVVL